MRNSEKVLVELSKQGKYTILDRKLYYIGKPYTSRGVRTVWGRVSVNLL